MPSLTGHKVLLAEDEFVVAWHLETVLEDAGAEVVVAATVDEATAAARDGIDCAVLDVSLLDGDVFPAADILDERGVPFLFQSGHANIEGLKVRYPRSEALSKPADAEVLVRCLARCIERGGGGGSGSASGTGTRGSGSDPDRTPA